MPKGSCRIISKLGNERFFFVTIQQLFAPDSLDFSPFYSPRFFLYLSI